MEQRHLAEIDKVWSEHFSEPWPELLDQFNRRVQQIATAHFWLPNRFCSPAWINGNPRRMESDQWVLVVSLNPHIDTRDNKLESKVDYKSGEWQSFWESFNETREHWKGQFFPRLGQLASTCLGLELDREQAKTFVYDRMLFVEFCPYASSGFPIIKWNDWKSLAEEDKGINISRQIRQLLFDSGKPALVLCNGQYAAYDVKDQQLDTNTMNIRTIRYKSPSGRSQLTTLYSGMYAPNQSQSFPVIGFHQIGRPNSTPTIEKEAIAQLAAELRHQQATS